MHRRDFLQGLATSAAGFELLARTPERNSANELAECPKSPQRNDGACLSGRLHSAR